LNVRHLLILALASLLVYTPGSTWGAPHATDEERIKAWGVDDESPMGPLAEISHIVMGPAPDRNLGYPLMHSFSVAAAYAPYLGGLLVTGKFTAPGGEYPYGFEDPVGALRNLTIIAHLVSVLFAMLTVLAAYSAGVFLWGERTGLLAGMFALASFPMFYYGRTGNVDAVQIGFMAMCLASFAYWLRDPRVLKGMLGIGVFGGFALATKEPIFAAFLPIAPAVVYLRWTSVRGEVPVRSWQFWRPAVYGVGALILAFGLGSGLFVDPERFFAHLRFAQERVAEAAAGEVAFSANYPNTVAGNLALAGNLLGYIVDSLTLPGCLLAAAGIVHSVRRAPRTALLALCSLTYLLVLATTARIGYLRYVMPAAFPLGLYAAHAVVSAWDSRHAPLRFGLAALAVVALGLGFLRGVDLTHAMLNDSRYTAGEWLSEQAGEGDRLEYHGPTQKLPPLAAGVGIRRSTPYLGGSVPHDRTSAKAAEIAAGWQERAPEFILAMPDYTSEAGEFHSHSLPPDAYAGLMDGAYGYGLAAEFQTPPLLPWVRTPGLDYWLVNPPIRIFVPGQAP